MSPNGVVPDEDLLAYVAGVRLAVGVYSLVASEVVGSKEGFVALGTGMSPHLRVGLEVGVEVVLAEETFWADGTLESAVAFIVVFLDRSFAVFITVAVVAFVVINSFVALGIKS
jgi:hypothetical protein